MQYKLIKPFNPSYSITEQILTNRGLDKEDISHYLNTTDDDINNPNLLDEKKLIAATTTLATAIKREQIAALVVDADCDGFCSSALLLNYLYNFFPTWVENNVKCYFHEGKQHGLSDCVDWIIDSGAEIAIVPDAGSNDIEQHQKLKENGIKTIIFDHHDLNVDSTDNAIVINIQGLDYPNKELAGTGVVWQFCRFLDNNFFDSDYADNYLDLVAFACIGDVMSLRSIETKHLINKGLQTQNIYNSFIQGMWNKNIFKLGDKLTATGVAFYIVPLINAIVRSGTQEEKEIVFKSMLDYCAETAIPSTKRGHMDGEYESLLQQSLRICANVKSRQTKIQNANFELLQSKIKQERLFENKIILLLLEQGMIDKNIAGLIASKIASEYQRPCCILTKNNDNVYQGSARGYERSGIADFKAICDNTHAVEYAAGHPNAFGIGIKQDNVEQFLQNVNEQLKDISTESIYYVDYIFNSNEIDPNIIFTISSLENLWGKDIEEPLIAIEHLKVTKQMVQLMSPDKSPTLKITLPNQIAIIKFNSSQEEYESLCSPEGYIEMNIIGKNNTNVWNGEKTPQIFITDYEITNSVKYLF